MRAAASETESRLNENTVLGWLITRPMRVDELLEQLGLGAASPNLVNRLIGVLQGAENAGKVVKRGDDRWTVTVWCALAFATNNLAIAQKAYADQLAKVLAWNVEGAVGEQ